MRYIEIKEDAKDDLSNVKLAQDYYNELVTRYKAEGKNSFKVLNTNTLTWDYDHDKDRVMWVVFKPLDEYPDLEVILEYPREDEDPGGIFYSKDRWMVFRDSGEPGSKLGKQIVVFLDEHQAKFMERDGKRMLSIEQTLKNKSVKNVIIHELIHYFDYKRTDDKIGAGKSAIDAIQKWKTDKEVYYNTPTEFNAHFLEGLERLMSSPFINEINAYNIMQNPQNFIKWAWDDTLFPQVIDKDYKRSTTTYEERGGFWEREFVNHLNDRNKRRVYKRLLGVYNLLKERFKKDIDVDQPIPKSIINSIMKV